MRAVSSGPWCRLPLVCHIGNRVFVSARFYIMTTASSHKTARPAPNESEMPIYRCDKCRKFDLLTKASKESTNRGALERGSLEPVRDLSVFLGVCGLCEAIGD